MAVISNKRGSCYVGNGSGGMNIFLSDFEHTLTGLVGLEHESGTT